MMKIKSLESLWSLCFIIGFNIFLLVGGIKNYQHYHSIKDLDAGPELKFYLSLLIIAIVFIVGGALINFFFANLPKEDRPPNYVDKGEYLEAIGTFAMIFPLILVTAKYLKLNKDVDGCFHSDLDFLFSHNVYEAEAPLLLVNFVRPNVNLAIESARKDWKADKVVGGVKSIHMVLSVVTRVLDLYAFGIVYKYYTVVGWHDAIFGWGALIAVLVLWGIIPFACYEVQYDRTLTVFEASTLTDDDIDSTFTSYIYFIRTSISVVTSISFKVPLLVMYLEVNSKHASHLLVLAAAFGIVQLVVSFGSYGLYFRIPRYTKAMKRIREEEEMETF